MATKILWISDKNDDPLEARMVIDRAEDRGFETGQSFNIVVNQALRAYLGLPDLDVAAARRAMREAKRAAQRARRATQEAEAAAQAAPTTKRAARK